ncbi:MAG: DDE domain-containing protein [Oxalobacteraceae bacterium]|nr:MAG: DDE domain-containing protein [Oxalobacteraceae bacterium]
MVDPASPHELGDTCPVERYSYRQPTAQPRPGELKPALLYYAAYPSAVTRLKQAGQLWRFSDLRQRKYLNNIVEQDHRRIKRLVRPGLGFSNLRTAKRTLAGHESAGNLRCRPVRGSRLNLTATATQHSSIRSLQQNPIHAKSERTTTANTTISKSMPGRPAPSVA